MGVRESRVAWLAFALTTGANVRAGALDLAPVAPANLPLPPSTRVRRSIGRPRLRASTDRLRPDRGRPRRSCHDGVTATVSMWSPEARQGAGTIRNPLNT